MERTFRECILSLLSLFFIVNTGLADGLNEYAIRPVPFTDVKITDSFWLPRIETNQEVTIPIAIEQSTLSGRIKNFEIAGGRAEGAFCSQFPFDDSDIYKIIEAASFSLQTHPDPVLESKLDSLIGLIAQAQEDDGYLYTNLTIAQKNGTPAHEWVGSGRWEKVNELSHELYNLGHLFEAATAHFQATGKRSLLDVAIKAADMLDRTFGWGKREDYPGHQVVEMGLVKLFRTTGEKRYLDLAKFFLDVRGPEGSDYNQAHAKVVDQREAVGHAVRATYMYSGIADVAALYNDKSYLQAIRAIWEDMVWRKTYITGGIGASGGNEGFQNPYELPNMSAYCETCASVGNIFWNYRMFLHDGDAQYIDVLERTLYNAFLSGVNLAGDRFFYPNVLESIGQHERSKWFGCACCPPNLARLLPSLPGYVYAKDDRSIYVNLYISNTSAITLDDSKVTIAQTTGYPWNGNVDIEVGPETPGKFSLLLRIPGWARNQALPGELYHFYDGEEEIVSLAVNGELQKIKMKNGYALLNREWKKGDKITLVLPMKPRVVMASGQIKADIGKMAVQRGPMVYAAEWPDVASGKVLNLIFDKDAPMDYVFQPGLLNGVGVVNARARLAKAKPDGGIEYGEDETVPLIPYYSWNNRGPGEMMVWLPCDESSVRPLPAPSIASKSQVSASSMAKSLVALNDQLLPQSSNDHTWPFYHWWPQNNSWEWVQYDFENTQTVSRVKVYWFDDGPWGGCRIPDAWEMEYQAGDTWKPVKAKTTYTVTKDAWDTVDFEPVTTKALRMKVKLSVDFSSGIHEWMVE
ncbi:MAG TPA: glycoside hydrolase family 127 protein [Prolixibacteraceae bacterium]|nr:glycoside hydrolase family 127 protein [Prolixibacteraceae bacterium]